MSPPPRRIPDDLTPAAVPHPRGRELTQRGGYGAPGPAIRHADDPAVVAELEAERARSSELLSELDRVKRSRNGLSEAIRQRSYSPPGMPAVRAEPEETTAPSLRPGREWIGVVVRRTDPKWLGLAIVLGILSWSLGGPEGITTKWEIAWGARQRDAKLAELERRLEKAENRATRSETHDAAAREDELAFRAWLRQVLERQGVQSELPAGAPPERAVRVTVPLRRPGSVTKGPALIVDTPMPLPPPVPSSTP